MYWRFNKNGKREYCERIHLNVTGISQNRDCLKNFEDSIVKKIEEAFDDVRIFKMNGEYILDIEFKGE